MAAFVLFSAAVGWFVGRPILKFVSEPEAFRLWVDSHGAWGRLAFLGMMVFQVIVALVPGEPLEIGAGYAFGFWEGTALCILGAVIGSALVFLLVRRYGVRMARVFFKEKDINSLKFLHDAKKRDALAFLIMFIPGTPKDLLGYFAGLTEMRFGTWMFITAVARIPSVVTSTIGGNALGIKAYGVALIVFAGTLVISGAGILIFRALKAG